MDWNRKHVLVTGGAGFIGSHLVDRLLADGARVTVIDDFSTGFREYVPSREHLRVVEADLLDEAPLREATRGVDFVFHLAANADIKDNLKAPRRCIEQNVTVTQNVLEAMRAAGVREVAFASTGSVYGDAAVLPTPEDAPFPVQTSLYATSKVAAEGLLTSYALGFGLRTWIFRFVSLLGPRYTHGHVVDFWRKLRRDPTRLEVLGDGHQKKSYLHVGDCIAAMLTAVNAGREPINVYNLGHTDWLEVNESIGIITRFLGVAPRLVYTGGDRGWVGDSPKILLDTTRIRSLGWAPTRTIEESIIETLRFLRDSPFIERRA
ncbi:MAG TPA: NAD-dependent epimerase/dehydratase family protein [Polyangiaceae bacterium]|nr:NAD-dependent epimerase/dehydratase family protein [Polyangiaceae bacterium]